MWSYSELGTQTVSYYHVVIVSSSTFDVIFNTTNTTLIIRGIISFITYNVIVVTVATRDNIDLFKSQPSDLITSMIMRGGNCVISMCIYNILFLSLSFNVPDSQY